jgi:hypothetical protein
MGRPKKATTPVIEEPQPEPEKFTLQAPANDNQPSVSKADMVRAAVAEGMESPADGVAFIKAKYGIDLPKPMWSSYRAQQKARDGKSAPAEKRGRKPKVAVDGQVAPAPKVEAKGDGNLLDALKTMKPLIAQYGVAKIKEMADLLG